MAIERVTQALDARGLVDGRPDHREVEPRIGAHGTLVIFIHPKDSDGVLIELMETPKGHH